jgi:hypothetical protein
MADYMDFMACGVCPTPMACRDRLYCNKKEQQENKQGIASLGPISDAIKRLGEERRNAPAEKTYVIFNTEYHGVEPNALEFVGSYRRLLEILNDIEKSDYDDLVPFPIYDTRHAWTVKVMLRWPNAVRRTENEFTFNGDIVGEYKGTGLGLLYKPYKEATNEELENSFNNANGDGNPYKLVYCVDDKKVVLK